MLFLGLGMAVFLEGLPYFVSPLAMRRYMDVVSSMTDGALRMIGLTMMIVGLAVAYLATR